jgi:benzoyl-CoA reductase/2-hydroxyglutaryl-CoA dehydratase subunit BcrC/BadD/HgdB
MSDSARGALFRPPPTGEERSMTEPFQRSLVIVNDMLKPMSRLLKANPIPPYDDYTHLLAAAIDHDVAHYLDVATAMEDRSRRVAMFEFGLVPQLFHAFDCASLCLEFFPGFHAGVDKNNVYAFLEAAEEAGIPSDTCSTDRFIVGATVSGELPTNSFFVTSSSPCDGTRIAYPILQKILGCPMLFLDAPFRDDGEAVRYYARQLKDRLIPFVEEQTGRKLDIDRFREVVAESNRAYQLLLDTLETYRVKPAPHHGMLRAAPYMLFLNGAGLPQTTETLELFREDAVARVREGRTEGPFPEKHRVMWVHVPPFYDWELFSWMEENLGATLIIDSLSSTSILEPIDTRSLETMLEGLAWQGLDMTMSIMRFESAAFVDFMVKAYDQFRCDCIIATQHVGCQSVCGARGLIREECRQRGIPLLFLEFDYNDDRVLAPEQMRAQIEDFFTAVMA